MITEALSWPRARGRRARKLGWALALCLGVTACSSGSAHPPPLADCPPSPGVVCTPPAGVGGGSSGPGEGGSSGASDGGFVDDASSCGGAGQLLNAANNQCPVCIEASCCLAAAACTGQCPRLVQCPSGTIASCESLYPEGITAYNDLASCIAQSCASECPSLPLASGAD